MNELLLAEAILGKDAQEFLDSDLGRYIAGRADQEAQEAAAKLKRIDPKDTEGIRALQNEIWRAEHLMIWLTELINGGNQAIQQLDEAQHV